MKSKRKFIEVNRASKDGYRWIENIGTAWRFAGFADDLARIDHKGWFTSEFQDETMRGVVYRLPSRKGNLVYFVGYQDPNNEDAAYGEIRMDLDDDNEAARAADRIAEIHAEKEREYNEAWQLGTEYARTFDEIESARAKRSELFAELRKLKTVTLPDTPGVCAMIQSRIKGLRRSVRTALNERKSIINDNRYIGRTQIEAFADGAGISLDRAKALF